MGLWDTHMHTAFSGDCNVLPEDMLATALEKGLAGITFTDHLDWDYPNEPGRFDLDLNLYHETMDALKEKHPGFLLKGIEVGLQEHLSEKHRALLNDSDFDYVIGSIHVVHGKDPYYPSYFEGRNAKEAYTEYFQCMLDNLQTFHGFDSLGHMDYVARYGMRHLGKEAGACHYGDYADLIDESFRFIMDHDISLEVNTGAYRCDMTEPNPSFEILKRYQKMGGKMITLGADAHHTEHVGLHFEKIADELRSIGFTSYLVYKDRKPEEMPL